MLSMPLSVEDEAARSWGKRRVELEARAMGIDVAKSRLIADRDTGPGPLQASASLQEAIALVPNAFAALQPDTESVIKVSASKALGWASTPARSEFRPSRPYGLGPFT